MKVLTIVDLTTKEVLIRQQVEEGKSSREMAKHIGIGSRTIRRFKERRAKGHQIYAKNGRPPSIDQISEDVITD